MRQELDEPLKLGKGEWSRDTRKYADRLLYKVGKVPVGCVDHPTVSKGNPRIARAVLYVPGITINNADYADDALAQARVEKAFATWVRWLGEPSND